MAEVADVTKGVERAEPPPEEALRRLIEQAAMNWWDGGRAGAARRWTADERSREEERWTLETRMS